jgi:hypothetical protein
MTTTTDHYLGTDVHKTDAYVAVMDEEGELVEEVHVASADLGEFAQRYEGSEATLEAVSNQSCICECCSLDRQCPAVCRQRPPLAR